MTTIIANILKRPRVTEKATVLASGQNGLVYTFEIPPAANKKQVMEAVKSYYKVTPVKVNIVNLPSRKVLVRGKIGTKTGVKKALVYLKKGDSIEFV
jgi:large subunit ribosomal protein L23